MVYLVRSVFITSADIIVFVGTVHKAGEFLRTSESLFQFPRHVWIQV